MHPSTYLPTYLRSCFPSSLVFQIKQCFFLLMLSTVCFFYYGQAIQKCVILKTTCNYLPNDGHCFLFEFVLRKNFFWDKVSLGHSGWPWTRYVVHASLDLLVILLPQSPLCWDYKHVLPCPAMLGFYIVWFLVVCLEAVGEIQDFRQTRQILSKASR